MAIADMWIDVMKLHDDFAWGMGHIVHTLTNRRCVVALSSSLCRPAWHGYDCGFPFSAFLCCLGKASNMHYSAQLSCCIHALLSSIR